MSMTLNHSEMNIGQLSEERERLKELLAKHKDMKNKPTYKAVEKELSSVRQYLNNKFKYAK